MIKPRIFLPLLLFTGGIALAGCAVTGPACTNMNDCVLKASINPTSGKLVISRTEVPNAHALIPGPATPAPSPSMPVTAFRQCKEANGTPEASVSQVAPGGYTYDCAITYVGTDGMDYQAGIPANSNSLGTTDTAGTGATESECVKGWYPEASTGNPAGIPGRWDDAVGLCIPTANGSSQFPGN